MTGRIALTGGIGSGKSAVAAVLEDRYGAAVYDADAHAKSYYDVFPEMTSYIESQLGVPIHTDGVFDRRKLAEAIFGEGKEEARRKVESIVHPAIFEDYRRWIDTVSGVSDIIVFESAILLQVDYPEGLFDHIVYVDAPEDIRVIRTMLRDGCLAGEAMARIESQKFSPDDPRVDYVIDNSGDFDALENEIDKMIKIL